MVYQDQGQPLIIYFNSSDNSVCYRGIFIEGLNISICSHGPFRMLVSQF